MAGGSTYEDANHFVFQGENVSGLVDTTSITGNPTGTLTVDGKDLSDLQIERDRLGWLTNAWVDGAPDSYTRSVTVILPQVHVEGSDAEDFDGVAIMVTRPTSIGGTDLVKGPLERYEVRKIAGTASTVRS